MPPGALTEPVAEILIAAALPPAVPFELPPPATRLVFVSEPTVISPAVAERLSVLALPRCPPLTDDTSPPRVPTPPASVTLVPVAAKLPPAPPEPPPLLPPRVELLNWPSVPAETAPVATSDIEPPAPPLPVGVIALPPRAKTPSGRFMLAAVTEMLPALPATVSPSKASPPRVDRLLKLLGLAIVAISPAPEAAIVLLPAFCEPSFRLSNPAVFS